MNTAILSAGPHGISKDALRKLGITNIDSHGNRLRKEGWVTYTDHKYIARAVADPENPRNRLRLVESGESMHLHKQTRVVQNNQVDTGNRHLTAEAEVTDMLAGLEDKGYFDPKSIEDERKRCIREIAERRGQPEFRKRLLDAYESQCAITGFDAPAALEAAHISPYRSLESNHVSNGLLLRSDIHVLFDMNLLGIEPEELRVQLAPVLGSTTYANLREQKLRIPSDRHAQPSTLALAERWAQFIRGDGHK
jgi:hypothetical protein